MTKSESPVSRTSIAILLGLPLILWIFVALHVLRLSTGFNFLVKHLGPFVVFGTMTLLPLAAAIMGWRTLRRKTSSTSARIALLGGGLMFVGFIVYPGIPLVRKHLEPKTPILPTTPTQLPAMTGLPVFPGAEGFGTRTSAGRGGKVIEVTSLADSGPGTLRAAIEDPAPRTIVFRTGGTIALTRQLILIHPFVTIAGQTAPGGGICLKNAGLVIATHDVLVQHLRVRPGNEGSIEPDDNDAISVLGGRGRPAEGAWNVVLDHISASWSEDETVSTWFGAHDVTVSWCIVSEGLDRSRHHKGTHSTGLLIGDGSDHVTMHHTLLVHNSFRNPLVSKGGTHDIVNNVIYDWKDIPAEVFDENSNSFVNFVGNHFQAGRSEKSPGGLEIIINSAGVPHLYVEGNQGAHRTPAGADDWSLVSYKWTREIAPDRYRSTTRYAAWPVQSTSAAEALPAVLAHSGATLPARDGVDARIVADVKNGTGGIINSPAEVGGYPSVKSGTAPQDTDHDGMPDDWERAHGLNPTDPTDGNGDADRDGYTNLEGYLHSLLR